MREKVIEPVEKQQIYDILNECYFSENCHEKEVLNNFGRLVPEGGVFVDVGASLGQFTRYAAAYLGQSRIICIEADPVRFEELERNCRVWGQEYHVPIEATHSAVSSEDTSEITFYTTNSNVSGGLFSHTDAQAIDWQPISFPALTLDSMFPDKPPEFVKVDIEGGEYQMLLGAKKILEQNQTVFLMELHPWIDQEGKDPAKESRELFKCFGYYSVSFYGKQLFLPLGLPYFREKLYAPFRKIKSLLNTE